MVRGLSVAPWLALALLCGLAYFWRLGTDGIFDLDEGLYAEAAREMALTGDLVTPRVNGQPFYEKPPVIYWEAAACFRILGRSEFAARLPSAIATTLLVGLIFAFGSKLAGRSAAFYGAVLFALSPLVFGEARQLTTDASLDLWVAVALVCFYVAHSSSDPRSKRWYYGFWAACAVGVLTKGSAGILPIIIALVFAAIQSRFRLRAMARSMREWRIAAGLLLLLAVVLPWHVAAYRANGPAFVDEWIVRQNLARFRGGDSAHRAPIWFYVPGFLLGAFPWSFLLVPAALGMRAVIRQGERRSGETEQNGRRADAGTPGAEESSNHPITRPPNHAATIFLLSWIAVVFGIFSLSGSKLVSYILPMYPPAALLTGQWLARLAHDVRVRRGQIGWGAAAFALAAATEGLVLARGPLLRIAERLTHQRIVIPPEQMVLFPFAEHLLAAAGLGVLVFTVSAAAGRTRAAIGALAAGMALTLGIAIVEGLPAVDRAFSAPLHEAAREAGAIAAGGIPLGIDLGKPSRPSAYFYLPDSLLPQRPGSSSSVLEASNNDSAVDRFASGTTPRVLLTSTQRAARLMSAVSTGTHGVPQIRISSRIHGWEVLLLAGMARR